MTDETVVGGLANASAVAGRATLRVGRGFRGAVASVAAARSGRVEDNQDD